MAIEVRQPRGTVKVQRQELSPEQISVTLAVGSYPQASLTVHQGEDAINKATQVFSKTTASKLYEAQQLIYSRDAFNPFSVADTTLTLEDGQGNLLEFLGRMNSGQFHQGYASVGYEYSVLHASAVLDSLSTSVYKPSFTRLRQDILEKELANFDFDNIPKVFSQITDLLIKHDETDQLPDSGLSELAKATRQAAVERNSTLLPLWREICEASEDVNTRTTLGQIDIEAIKLDIVKHIINTLLRKTSSFFQTMMDLAGSFQLLWVPDFSRPSRVGRFIPYSMAFGQFPQVVRMLDIGNVSFATGSDSLLPVKNVQIKGYYQMYLRNATGATESSVATPYYVYPEDSQVSSGRTFEAAGPPWMKMLPTVIPIDMPEADLPRGSDTPRIGQASYQRSKQKISTLLGEIQEKYYVPVIKDWASNIYDYTTKQYSRTSLTIPMDLSIQPGQRWLVRNANGSDMFLGFLQSVTHKLHLAPGSAQGSATSHLSFTHVDPLP